MTPGAPKTHSDLLELFYNLLLGSYYKTNDKKKDLLHKTDDKNIMSEFAILLWKQANLTLQKQTYAILDGWMERWLWLLLRLLVNIAANTASTEAFISTATTGSLLAATAVTAACATAAAGPLLGK